MAPKMPPPAGYQPWSGRVQVLTGAVLISFSAVFVKLSHTTPSVTGFYRMLFGGAILLAVALARRRKATLSRGTYLRLAACGFIFFLDLFCWHRSVLFIGPGLATIIGNFQVFFLAGFGILLYGERFSRRFLGAVLLAFTGLLLLVGPNWTILGPNHRNGVFLGIGTAMAYAAYLLMLRHSQEAAPAMDTFEGVGLISMATAICFALKIITTGQSFVIPDRVSLYALGGYGLFSQFCGWVLISRGLPRIPASQAGLILLMQPSLSFVWDVLLFHRPVSTADLTGLTLAISGIYLGTHLHRDDQ